MAAQLHEQPPLRNDEIRQRSRPKTRDAEVGLQIVYEARPEALLGSVAAIAEDDANRSQLILHKCVQDQVPILRHTLPVIRRRSDLAGNLRISPQTGADCGRCARGGVEPGTVTSHDAAHLIVCVRQLCAE
ncbi:hypothetical protein D3C86_1467380 [compost metagenome]